MQRMGRHEETYLPDFSHRERAKRDVMREESDWQ